MKSINCPVCESPDISLFMKGIFDCEKTEVMECNGCGLQFLEPMMNEEEEGEYYRNYYEKQKTRHFKDLNLKDIQENALQHYVQYNNIYASLIDGKKSILEIGSGSGGFIKFVKNVAPQAKIVSIERSESNLAFLKNEFDDISFKETIEDLDVDSRFDLIVAFGVFEHVKDSSKFLEMLKPYLNEGRGILALNIPNKKNPLVSTYCLDEFKKFTYMKQHYYTYTEHSLKIVAEKTGYEVEKFNYMQVWGLDNHLSWLRYREPRDFSQYTKMLSDATLGSYNSDLIKEKTTDLMMVVMHKK